jgi:hypothetical protein
VHFVTVRQESCSADLPSHCLVALSFIAGTHFLIDRFRLARWIVWIKNGESIFETPTDSGYPLDMPPWLSTWLFIIADNTPWFGACASPDANSTIAPDLQWPRVGAAHMKRPTSNPLLGSSLMCRPPRVTVRDMREQFGEGKRLEWRRADPADFSCPIDDALLRRRRAT